MFNQCFKTPTTEERIKDLKREIYDCSVLINHNDKEVVDIRKGYFQFATLVKTKHRPALHAEINNKLLGIKQRNKILENKIIKAFHEIDRLEPVQAPESPRSSTDSNDEKAALVRRRRVP